MFFTLSAARLEAGSITLAWDPSQDPAVAGYTIAYGTQPGNYTWSVDVSNTTTYTLGSLPDGKYYFAVRAYALDGTLSAYSNEVAATVTTTTPPAPGSSTPSPTPTTSCTTPDPFASMGGGTCYNRGWLPPGMAIPGSTAPAPAPTPSSPSSTAGCKTADPFANMGGGTCYNGGWLPPGMSIPTGGTSPNPAPTAPPPPSSVQGCSTPDPFAAMGGGTCYNGGWLPPGLPKPAGSTTPAPTPAPESPSHNAACGTSDPFSVLGGGTCYRGAWLPPGMQVTIRGTLHVVDDEGHWVIETADGVIYTAAFELTAEQLVDGASVTIEAVTLPSASSEDGAFAVEILTFGIQQ